MTPTFRPFGKQIHTGHFFDVEHGRGLFGCTAIAVSRKTGLISVTDGTRYRKSIIHHAGAQRVGYAEES